VPVLRHTLAVRRFRESNEFLRFDQTFERTLGVIQPEWSLPMVIFFNRLIKDASGVTAIEYGLISALIVVGSFLALNSVNVSLNLKNTFLTVATNM
jgi:Flp pilus assembly pilin Flp